MGHSSDVSNPLGEASVRRASMQPALDLDLMGRIFESRNVAKAWEQVRRNRGAPGVDEISVEEFPEATRPRWHEIADRAFSGSGLWIRFVGVGEGEARARSER